eukprot:TRINITY_DN1187_c0_g2_i1.p1 TRINITY_DN1187_c0_g2~~TRINITY_DN1187_c0_g2_i1.p1  ORF type:complete len:201 (-),score=32.81 TRINITY_DN1187_c0_g2_i1:13-615(-)
MLMDEQKKDDKKIDDCPWNSRLWQVQSGYYIRELKIVVTSLELPMEIVQLVSTYASEGWNRVGVRLDVKDSNNKWCIGEVVELKADESVVDIRIHYVGWPSVYDEWMLTTSARLAHPGSQVVPFFPSEPSAGLLDGATEIALIEYMESLGLPHERCVELLRTYGFKRRCEVMNLVTLWKEQGPDILPEQVKHVFVVNNDQ